MSTELRGANRCVAWGAAGRGRLFFLSADLSADRGWRRTRTRTQTGDGRPRLSRESGQRYSGAMRSASVVVLAVACLCFGCQGAGSAGGEGGAGGAGAPSLEILGVVAPDAKCTYSTEDGQALEMGSWDLASPDDYSIVLVIENLLESEVANPLQGELNRIQVTSIHITLLEPNGTPLELGDLPNPFSAAASGVVPPMGSEQAPRAAVGAVGVPSSFASALAALDLEELVVALEARGSTTRGDDARSLPLPFTVRLCGECLLEVCAGSKPPGAACTPGRNGDPWCRP